MTLVADSFHGQLSRRLGVYNGAARIYNATQAVGVYGYTEPVRADGKLFRAMNIRTGVFSATSVSVLNGDLIHDLHDDIYAYVTNRQYRDYAYTAELYCCNALVVIAHPTKIEDAFRRQTSGWVEHYIDLRALISLENYLAVESGKGGRTDKTLYYCYVPFTTSVHQGDMISDGTRQYAVQNVDEISFNGAMKIVEMVITTTTASAEAFITAGSHLTTEGGSGITI